MSYISTPTHTAIAAPPEIPRRSLQAILRGSAAERALAAVYLIEACIRVGIAIAPAVAAMVLRVGVASVRTVLRAGPRDRLALIAGASIGSIKRSSAPKLQPSLASLWHSASEAERVSLTRTLDPGVLLELGEEAKGAASVLTRLAATNGYATPDMDGAGAHFGFERESNQTLRPKQR